MDFNVRGRQSDLSEYWKTQGGSTAYLGSYMPGFPNMVLLLGPNVATGHASAIFSEESQVVLLVSIAT